MDDFGAMSSFIEGLTLGPSISEKIGELSTVEAVKLVVASSLDVWARIHGMDSVDIVEDMLEMMKEAHARREKRGSEDED